MHRDLTSNNCLLRGTGAVVVADFGLARVVEAGSFLPRTAMSPSPDQHIHRLTIVGSPCVWLLAVFLSIRRRATHALVPVRRTA
jgi:serine/threonine protein kinase